MKQIILTITLIVAITCLEPSPIPDKSTCNQLLDLHNKERSIIGLKDLSWSDDLTEASQQWANYLASTKQFKHSGTGGVGENIARAGYRSGDMTAFMFSQWSSEKKYFNPTAKWGEGATTVAGKDIGHYTQIIWSYTYEVGCGIAKGESWAYLVCQYRYPGNFIGNYVYKPDPENPWRVANSDFDAASLPKPPSTNYQPEMMNSDDAELLLDLHNQERDFVGMKRMTWSKTLAASAQAHANKQAKAGTFYKSGTPKVGENMKSITIGPNMIKLMFNTWANEKIYFDATQRYPQCAIENKMISHYTQIVWSASKEVGCGMATNSKNSILVCQYSLAGNYRGNFVVYPAPSVNFNFQKN